jgi:hypothetical protein
VEAPATPQVISPTVGNVRERESVSEKKKILDNCVGRERERECWIIVINLTPWKLIRKPLGTSWP